MFRITQSLQWTLIKNLYFKAVKFKKHYKEKVWTFLCVKKSKIDKITEKDKHQKSTRERDEIRRKYTGTFKYILRIK